MKIHRVILVCTLLLLAVTPSYAEPTCTECLDESSCVNAPGAPLRCRFIGGVCQTIITSNCVGRSETPVLTDWKVASVEVCRRAPGAKDLQKTVIAPEVVAQVETPHVSTVK